MKKNPSRSSKYSIEYIRSDLEGFRITKRLLERLLEEAKEVNKKPKLIIALNKTENELFILECNLKIEKK